MNSTVVCLKTSYTKAERGQKTGLVAYCLGKFKIKTKSVFLNELKRKPAHPPEKKKKKKKKREKQKRKSWSGTSGASSGSVSRGRYATVVGVQQYLYPFQNRSPVLGTRYSGVLGIKINRSCAVVKGLFLSVPYFCKYPIFVARIFVSTLFLSVPYFCQYPIFVSTLFLSVPYSCQYLIPGICQVPNMRS